MLFIDKIIFWLSFFGIFYAYFGYPIVLCIIGKFRRKSSTSYSPHYEPFVSIIIPVFNEEAVIKEKMLNIKSLNYSKDKLEVLIVSDGSTDNTREIVRSNLCPWIKFYELPERGGKASALNFGLEKAKNEIIIFSDSSIMLERDAFKNIVKKFQDEKIGCISGEDHIKESDGEGLYGKYELYLRNQESKVHSIVGASGSFYAQRKKLCMPFMEGMAPDFLSVLTTVENGYRAITEPDAYGTMTSLKSTRDEFNRKVRTLIRGMSALFYRKSIMNPFRFGIFSFELLSHKLMRWYVPFFIITLFLTNIFLIDIDFYLLTFICQAVFYFLTILALLKCGNIHEKIFGKIPLFFSIVNAAILVAWFRYIIGIRQEVWNPSKREHKV